MSQLPPAESMQKRSLKKRPRATTRFIPYIIKQLLHLVSPMTEEKVIKPGAYEFSSYADEEKKEEHPSDYTMANGPQQDSVEKTRPKSSNSEIQATPLQVQKRRSSPLDACFRLGVHGLLFLLCLAFATVYCIRLIHDDYFVPIVRRARRTDEDLKQEYTYYERQCSVVDVTATREEASQLIEGKDSSDGVAKMMTHGAIMMPQLLPEALIQEMREFVVWKNNAVRGTPDEYPVTEGDHRISYGIEATEHPTVIKALKAIHANTFLKDVLEEIVGKNPALTELTAITSQYGSNHQPWHPDVKPDGDGVQFGRTYSHSYSLFIPLQNTTGKMGATDLCPGTHYCANWIDAQCEQRRIGLHEIHPDGVWRAGDAALLNQQVWHRGTQHTDPNAQDRILFIMSFIGRPSDNRQLSRGTYFHMKWNMWGHTWQDLADAVTSMARPYNILRCLHLWKPKGRQWGFDLFTSAALRIANNQLGCEPEDLQLFLNVLERIRFPEWLHGTVDMEDRLAWQIYFRETITNVFNFLLKLNCFAVGLYVFGVLILKKKDDSSNLRLVARSILGLCPTYGIVVGLTLFVVHTIRSSPWAVNISSGKTLMRPFPPVSTTISASSTIWRDEVSTGPTTVPQRYDVLVGTRLASKTIGVYSRWHEFHPGNARFRKYIAEFGGSFYRSYENGLPSIFHTNMIEAAMAINEGENGRFLQQDYRTGDWILMSESETRTYVAQRLRVGSNTLLASIKEEVEFMKGEYRFGVLRGTALSRISQSYIHEIEKLLFHQQSATLDPSKSSVQRLGQAASSKEFSPVSYWTPSNFVNATFSHGKHAKGPARTAQSRYWSSFVKSDLPAVRPLVEVFAELEYEEGVFDYVPATILQVSSDDQVEIALYGDMPYDFDGNPTLWISRNQLSPRPRPISGLRVLGNFMGQGQYFHGTIQRVLPSGRADILYDDGDFEEGVHMDDFEILTGSEAE
eukprot:scaffold1580_cov116-Cylindrotheca_fusiformis.AAC.3